MSQRRIALFAVTDLEHDVLLLHADSDDADGLAFVIRRKLKDQSKPPYKVFDYRYDLPFGQSMLQQSLYLQLF